MNSLDANRQSALHIAVLSDNFYHYKWLRDNGADPSLQDKNGNTPIHLAAWLRRAEIFEFIKENSEFVATTCQLTNKNGHVPLHLAYMSADEPWISFLDNFTDNSDVIDCQGHIPKFYESMERDQILRIYPDYREIFSWND